MAGSLSLSHSLSPSVSPSALCVRPLQEVRRVHALYVDRLKALYEVCKKGLYPPPVLRNLSLLLLHEQTHKVAGGMADVALKIV